MTLRYVEKLEYVDADTGVVYDDMTRVPDGADLVERAVEYRDVDYTVAVLEAVGMTARQLRAMLALEGLAYTLGAALLALALAALAGPVLGAAVEHIVWFFTFRSSLWPVAALGAAFAVLGMAIPLAADRAARTRSVVDRLRQE